MMVKVRYTRDIGNRNIDFIKYNYLYFYNEPQNE